jgi:hypothetical protein
MTAFRTTLRKAGVDSTGPGDQYRARLEDVMAAVVKYVAREAGVALPDMEHAAA